MILGVANQLTEAAVRQNVAKLYARCVNHASRLTAYLASENSGRAIGVTDTWCPHMSHNLWNLQTGWANVLEHANSARIDSLFCCGGQNFFGSREELFSDRIPSTLPLVPIDSDARLFEEMLARNLLLFCARTSFSRQIS
jgi:hypothetical protein